MSTRSVYDRANLHSQLTRLLSDCPSLFFFLLPLGPPRKDLPYYYGAPPASTIIDGNVVTVRVAAPSEDENEDADGAKANVTVLGAGSDQCFHVVNEVQDRFQVQGEIIQAANNKVMTFGEK